MTDQFRAMCAELVEAMTDDSTGCWQREADVIDHARALLAEPVAESPADGEVAELQRWGVDHGAQPGRPLLSPMEDGYWTPWHIAADLLQRQHPQPVAVSERLPGPEDCDEQGRCWLGGDQLASGSPTWILGYPDWASRFPDVHYRWLPANALPLPAGEGAS